MNGNIEEFKTEVITLRNELKEAKHLVLQCQKGNSTLSKELDETKQQLIELKQYSRREQPATDNDDIRKFIEAITSHSSGQLPSDDIEIAHQLA